MENDLLAAVNGRTRRSIDADNLQVRLQAWLTLHPDVPPALAPNGSSTLELQGPLEKLSYILLGLVHEIGDLLDKLYARNASTGSILSFKSHSRIKAAVAACLETLEDTKFRIQQLHLITTLEYENPTMKHTSLSHLLTVDSHLEALLFHLRETPIEQKSIFRAIDSFHELAKNWLVDTSGFIEPPVDTVSDSSKRPESNSPGLSHIDRTSLNSTADSTVCPLEDALRRAGIVTKASCSFSAFANWAESLHNPSSTISAVGVVRSIHLFRGKKAPFYHEYVLISFQTETNVMSWLRLERAARAKAQWFLPRADSLGPLRRGVTLRESASFATSDIALNHDSDELTSIIFDQVSEYSRRTRLSLPELAHLVQITSDTFPKYQLFTANCRYFARSIILRLLEWASTSGARHRIEWEGAVSTTRDVTEKLPREPFGGKQLEGAQGTLLRAGSLITLARTLISHGRPIDAINLCEQTIGTLHTISLPSAQQQYLFALAFSSLGSALTLLHRHLEALEAYEKACNASRPIQSTHQSLFHNALVGRSLTLYALNRSDEAYSHQREAFVVSRAILDATTKPTTIAEIAHSLARQAMYLREVPGKADEALSTIKEAIKLWRILHAQDSDLYEYRDNLVNTLEVCADMVNDIGDSAQANELMFEANSLTLPIAVAYGNSHRVDFTSHLSALGFPVRGALRMPDALAAVEDALELYRVVHIAEPNEYRDHLALALELHSDALCGMHRDIEACEATRIVPTIPRYISNRSCTPSR